MMFFDELLNFINGRCKTPPHNTEAQPRSYRQNPSKQRPFPQLQEGNFIWLMRKLLKT